MTLTSKVLTALLFAIVLAGCGQSGPLYIPGDPSSVQEPETTRETTEELDERNEEDEG